MANLPDVPTIKEPVLQAPTCSSGTASGAAGTPKDVIVRLNREIVKAMNTPDVRDKFAQQGVDPREHPEEFAEFIRTEVARWARSYAPRHQARIMITIASAKGL
jgi:tripartite-type tricarboxylate transporter receptor subunit TctC